MRIIHSQHWGNPFRALLFLCSVWCQNTDRKSKMGGVGQPLPDRAAPVHLIRHAKWAVYISTFGKVILKVNYRFLLFSRKLVYLCFLQSWGTAGVHCCSHSLFAVALSAPPCTPLLFPRLSFFKPRAGGEEWMTFSCLCFLCQKISKRHCSCLNGLNQSIPGHNKLAPIKS